MQMFGPKISNIIKNYLLSSTKPKNILFGERGYYLVITYALPMQYLYK